MPAGNENEVSGETRMLIDSVRAQAAQMPGPAELADLLTAPGRRAAVTEADVRRLGRKAIEQAQQMSYLLGKLAGLAGGEGGRP